MENQKAKIVPDMLKESIENSEILEMMREHLNVQSIETSEENATLDRQDLPVKKIPIILDNDQSGTVMPLETTLGGEMQQELIAVLQDHENAIQNVDDSGSEIEMGEPAVDVNLELHAEDTIESKSVIESITFEKKSINELGSVVDALATESKDQMAVARGSIVETNEPVALMNVHERLELKEEQEINSISPGHPENSSSVNMGIQFLETETKTEMHENIHDVNGSDGSMEIPENLEQTQNFQTPARGNSSSNTIAGDEEGNLIKIIAENTIVEQKTKQVEHTRDDAMERDMVGEESRIDIDGVESIAEVIDQTQNQPSNVQTPETLLFSIAADGNSKNADHERDQKPINYGTIASTESINMLDTDRDVKLEDTKLEGTVLNEQSLKLDIHDSNNESISSRIETSLQDQNLEMRHVDNANESNEKFEGSENEMNDIGAITMVSESQDAAGGTLPIRELSPTRYPDIQMDPESKIEYSESSILGETRLEDHNLEMRKVDNAKESYPMVTGSENEIGETRPINFVPESKDATGGTLPIRESQTRSLDHQMASESKIQYSESSILSETRLEDQNLEMRNVDNANESYPIVASSDNEMNEIGETSAINTVHESKDTAGGSLQIRQLSPTRSPDNQMDAESKIECSKSSILNEPRQEDQTAPESKLQDQVSRSSNRRLSFEQIETATAGEFITVNTNLVMENNVASENSPVVLAGDVNVFEHVNKSAFEKSAVPESNDGEIAAEISILSQEQKGLETENIQSPDQRSHGLEIVPGEEKSFRSDIDSPDALNQDLASNRNAIREEIRDSSNLELQNVPDASPTPVAVQPKANYSMEAQIPQIHGKDIFKDDLEQNKEPIQARNELNIHSFDPKLEPDEKRSLNPISPIENWPRSQAGIISPPTPLHLKSEKMAFQEREDLSPLVLKEMPAIPQEVDEVDSGKASCSSSSSGAVSGIHTEELMQNQTINHTSNANDQIYQYNQDPLVYVGPRQYSYPQQYSNQYYGGYDPHTNYYNYQAPAQVYPAVYASPDQPIQYQPTAKVVYNPVSFQRADPPFNSNETLDSSKLNRHSSISAKSFKNPERYCCGIFQSKKKCYFICAPILLILLGVLGRFQLTKVLLAFMYFLAFQIFPWDHQEVFSIKIAINTLQIGSIEDFRNGKFTANFTLRVVITVQSDNFINWQASSVYAEGFIIHPVNSLSKKEVPDRIGFGEAKDVKIPPKQTSSFNLVCNF
jgi:hypothetical protein